MTDHIQLHCQFEADYYRERESNESQRVYLQGSHKKACAAHMSVKYITLFPEYTLPSHMASSFSKLELQQEMESKMTQLKQDLACVKPLHAESKGKYFQLRMHTNFIKYKLDLLGLVQNEPKSS